MVKTHTIMRKQIKIRRKKIHNLIYLKIKLTPRNIFSTLTSANGEVLFKSSTGLLGYKGNKKTTSFVAGVIVKYMLRNILIRNIKYNFIIIQYIGDRNDKQFNSILRAIKSYRLRKLIYLEFLEKEAHNGVRPKKKSR